MLERVQSSVRRYKPGIPTDPATTMGSIVSKVQYERVLGYIEAGKADGARLLAGGKRPSEPHLAKGFYVEPTVFADVTMDMRIGKEEIFGPILSILKWSDEERMLAQVNQVEYGLTCSIWTNDLVTAHRVAGAVEAGFVWINDVSKHFLGAPFGGYKQSGVGREEGIEELLSFTREKNIHVNLKRRAGQPKRILARSDSRVGWAKSPAGTARSCSTAAGDFAHAGATPGHCARARRADETIENAQCPPYGSRAGGARRRGVVVPLRPQAASRPSTSFSPCGAAARRACEPSRPSTCCRSAARAPRRVIVAFTIVAFFYRQGGRIAGLMLAGRAGPAAGRVPAIHVLAAARAGRDGGETTWPRRARPWRFGTKEIKRTGPAASAAGPAGIRFGFCYTIRLAAATTIPVTTTAMLDSSSNSFKALAMFELPRCDAEVPSAPPSALPYRGKKVAECGRSGGEKGARP